MYYTERKPKNENGGSLGMRLTFGYYSVLSLWAFPAWLLYLKCMHKYTYVNILSGLPLSLHAFPKWECLWHSIFIFLFTAALAVVRTAFGQGTGPIYLSSVICTGTESSLLSCSHSGIGVISCGHYYDAGVVCPTCKLVNAQASTQIRSCHWLCMCHSCMSQVRISKIR